MFTAQEMREMGYSEEEVEEIERKNAEVIKKRSAELPTTQAGLDKLFESMPLTATHMPEGEENELFEAMKALQKEIPAEERAEALKESGNEAFKLAKTEGAKRYRDAEVYYTQALECNGKDTKVNSQIYSNRALVHLTTANYGHCVADCDKAIALHAANVKAYLRAAKACLHVHKLEKSREYLTRGQEQKCTDAEKKAFKEASDELAAEEKKEADAKREREEKKLREEHAENARKSQFEAACKKRGIRIGPAEFDYKQYQTMAGVEKSKPRFDEIANELHWPVVFLYPEHLQSDFIQAFSEYHCFQDHLNAMFPPQVPPAPWDEKKQYRSDNLRVYYLSKAKGDSKAQPKAKAAAGGAAAASSSPDSGLAPGMEKVYVNTDVALGKVLARKDFVVPDIPVFYVERKVS